MNLDGPNIIIVDDPICSDNGCLDLALYGSFLPIPSTDLFKIHKQNDIISKSIENSDDYVLVESNE